MNIEKIDNQEDLKPEDEYYDHNDSDNRCFLCGKPNYKKRANVSHYGFPILFKECQCGLVKQTPMPNKDFFSWFFNSSVFYSSHKTRKKNIWGYYNYFSEESSRLRTDNWRINKLRKHFEELNKDLSKIKLLQIGSGGGSFLYMCKKIGIDAKGIDISQGFAEFASKTYNVEVDVGRFEDTNYNDEEFDVIALFNVIENVPNQQEFLTAINRKMKKNGLFVLNFVDTNNNIIESIQKEKYFLYRPPVTYIFDSPVLCRVLHKFGFKQIGLFHDIRVLELEKILTLLRLNWLQKIMEIFGLSKIQFRLWAYPSRVVIAKKY